MHSKERRRASLPRVLHRETGRLSGTAGVRPYTPESAFCEAAPHVKHPRRVVQRRLTAFFGNTIPGTSTDTIWQIAPLRRHGYGGSCPAGLARQVRARTDFKPSPREVCSAFCPRSTRAVVPPAHGGIRRVGAPSELRPWCYRPRRISRSPPYRNLLEKRLLVSSRWLNSCCRLQRSSLLLLRL
jgi:hypothetical protein